MNSLSSLGACPEVPADWRELLQLITEIGAPTGQERARAEAIARWFDQLQPGLAVRDELHNVVVDLSGGKAGLWLLDAHTDTVFADSALCVVKDDSVWRCPGICDDTISVVFLMLLIRELLERGERWPLIFSFTVGEEGEGDLRGIRAVGERLQKRVRGAWAVDFRLDYATTAAVGSKRWRITWTAAGGHSWGDFGQPSAIHAMSEWISSLSAAAEWKPFTLSYNVGKVSGGTTVNSLAENAACVLDLRSVNPELLKQASAAVLAKAREIAGRHSVKVSCEAIGDRPAGMVPNDPPLFEWIQEIHSELGIPLNAIANSTNANALLALGIPATCTGLSLGEGNHTREEWLELQSVPIGWRKLWKMVERVLR